MARKARQLEVSCLQVLGGGATSNAGGGGGGRLAVYWQDYDWWFGSMQAYGGPGGYSHGAAGTIYIEVGRVHTVAPQ